MSTDTPLPYQRNTGQRKLASNYSTMFAELTSSIIPWGLSPSLRMLSHRHSHSPYFPDVGFIRLRELRAWYLLILQSWHIKVSHSQNTDIMLCHCGAVWGRRCHLLTSLSHKHETREGCRAERWEKSKVGRGRRKFTRAGGEMKRGQGKEAGRRSLKL